MEVLSTTPTFATSSSLDTASKKDAVSSDFETFLKMLTAQMKNQDPLNPIESSDFAVQLATFSGVEQQVKSNDLLTQLGQQMSVMGMAQLAGWVGMDAKAVAPAYFDGTPVTIEPDPSLTADEAVMVVRNTSGTEVQRLTVPVSSEPIVWAGVDANGNLLPVGLYSFAIESLSGGKITDVSSAQTYARIAEVRIDAGETILIMEGGAQVAASAVSALRAP